jgi:hypothetical protein
VKPSAGLDEALHQARESTDNYVLVLLLLSLSIVLPALLPSSDWLLPLQSLALVAATLIALHSSRVPAALFWFAVLLVVVWLTAVAREFQQFPTLALGVVGALLVLSPASIGWRIFRHRQVTVRTIAGAVCIYLQVGLAFAFLYHIVYRVHPASLDTGGPVSPGTFVYYSFITLTTVGYGDIKPMTDPVRMAAVAEALMGQVYLVVVVARLVSLLGHEPALTASERLALQRAAASGRVDPEALPAAPDEGDAGADSR